MHFFLHGGMARIDSEKNKKFFQSICKDGDKILICVFATTDKSTWEERFGNYQKQFAKYNPEKKLSFELASEDIPTFIQQIDRCTMVYFGWWYEDNIFPIVNKIPDLRKLLSNKVVVGSSAGANIWAKSFYTQDFETVEQWLGRLPIKTICHRWPGMYAADEATNDQRMKELDECGEKLPIYKIPEQEYIEFTL